jgi:4-diphosphocytidyl-2-C-methyl-D-erythritol kinase
VPNKLTAKAKINLCLHVTGQRTDGYHLLDSLVVFADYGDTLHFAPSDAYSLTIGGPFGAGLSASDDNLITRAAMTLGGRGALVHLIKNLPVASGIGGGSADGAAALRGLATLWNVALPSDEGLELGADVPVCLRGCASRMRGIGDVLESVDFLPEMPAVLVNSGDAVSTAQVFNALPRKYNKPMPTLPNDRLDFPQTVEYLKAQRNDLQAPAIDAVPNIQTVLDALDASADFSQMSGSGATCFGLYKTSADANQAAQSISDANPDWWVQAVMLNARD